MKRSTIATLLMIAGFAALACSTRGFAAAQDEELNTLTAAEKKAGWKLLFDGKTLNGWRRYNNKDTTGWAVKNGGITLLKPGSGDLITKKKYGNFEFSVDWKFETGNNSGIIYRLAETKGAPWTTGPEMQVMSHNPDQKNLGKNSGGSLYDMYAPTSNPFKGKDVWTRYKIVARGKHIEHWVNGVKVVDCEIGSDDWKKRLANSKWKKYKDFASQSSGYISLQDHGGVIYYRSIKIRTLDKK